MSGEEFYLEPYHAAVQQIDETIEDLRNLTAADPIQQHLLDVLKAPVAEMLALQRQTIELRKSRGFKGAAPVFLTGKGYRLMQDIRTRVAEVKQEEEALLRSEEHTSELQS